MLNTGMGIHLKSAFITQFFFYLKVLHKKSSYNCKIVFFVSLLMLTINRFMVNIFGQSKNFERCNKSKFIKHKI